MNKNFPNTDRGITIISLVITIIVLLILAGISISIISANNTFDKAFESKVVTELSQLGEELNKIKINAEKNNISNGDFSGSLTNDILIKDKIILNTLSINNPSVRLGIIDASKFTTDSSLGNNANSYVSNNTLENVTELRNVYAINLETNDIYYINEKIYSLNGIIEPEDLNKPIIVSDGPTVSASKALDSQSGLSFTITVSPGKDNVPLKSQNKYEYYVSSKSNEIVGGNWASYESGKIFSTIQSFDKEYYLFVKIVEDEKNKVSTATGSNSADILVNGKKYHRFGPFVPDNASVLIIDPNGGKYKNSSASISIKGKIGDTVTINSSDITPGKGSTITFDPNGGNISNNTITANHIFKDWSFTGKGTFINNVYTFDKGSGIITANYQNLSITLPSSTKNGYIFDGWYTSKIGGIKIGMAGDSYIPANNITLYARWTPNKYTLTVNPNGGTWNNSTANSTFTQDYNTTKDIPNPVAPAGYTVTFDTDGGNSLPAITSTKSFSNWSKSGEGTLVNTTFTFGAGNTTLTANYSNNPITLPSTSKTGYTFDGWYSAKVGGEKVNEAGASYTPSSNVTLYARWIPNKYTIDLNLNVDGQSYDTGYNDRIYVKLKIDGQDKGYVQDFYESYNYGTKWEITGLKLDGKLLTYSDSGTLGASNLDLTKYFYTITFNVNNTDYGTISPTSLLVPNNNTKYSTNGSTLTLSDGRTVTAIVKELQGYSTTVSGWSPASGTITEKTTITANFVRTIASYTATFDSNGGSTANPISITKKFGEQLGALPTTSRTGYTFNGWYTSATGGSKINTTTTMPSNNVTYYAQWSINKYTLTVNPNGGIWNNTTATSTFTQNYNTTKDISNPVAPAGYTVTFDTDGGNSVPSQTSTKSFSNWSKSGEGSLVNTTFTFGAGNTDLTANYSNNSITLPNVTKSSYFFDGWYTSKTGGEKVGNAGDSYTPSSNVTLYARWSINKFYIDLNFNVDGQSYPSGYNDRIYVKLKINGQDKGYVQDFNEAYNYGTKWEITGLKLDGKEITYSDSGTLGTSNLDLTKYFYTMTINVNNSDFGSVSPTNLIVPNNNTKYSTTGTTLTLSDGRTVTATIKNQTGYTTTLSSWSPANGTITTKTTVTANFVRSINSYTATFNSNGGTSANPASITKKYGEQLGTLPTTSRTGYTFNGWYTSATGGSKINSTTTMPSNDVTYYAQWSINQYTLTVNPNGGIWNNTTATSTFTQNYNTTKDIPNPVAPAGYTVTFNTDGGNYVSSQTATKYFKDWTKSGAGTLTNTTFTFGAGDTTLTANYSNNPITLPSTSKTGYTFDGWYTSSGTRVGGSGSAYLPSSNITLYARWTPNKYNIDLNLNVDGQSYSYGYNNRIYVGLRIGGQDKGYVQDFSGSYNYGTSWEIYGLKLDGSIISYSDSGTLGASNLNLTKYFYTMTFNVNNSAYGSVSPTSLIVPNNNTTFSTSGSTLTLSDRRIVNATVTNQTGYTTTLSSWSPSSGTITTRTTVIANFVRTANNYTATFNSNGGTTASPSSITKKYGEQLGALPTTSREGYAFDGWYTATSGGTKISATTTMPANNVTYYAQWIDNTPPVITALTATATSASAYKLTITASDTGSGINGYYVSTSTTRPTASSTWLPSTSTTYTYNNAAPSTTYYVWVIDKAGNISASKSITTAAINYSVNNTKWCTTLNQAHSLAAAGNTIYLLTNYTDSSSVTISKNVNLSTNAHTLTRSTFINVNSGCTLNVTGSGTLKNNLTSANLINNSGTLTISHTGTITDVSGATRPLINNTGTLNKTGNGTLSSYYEAIHNTGTANISAGTVSVGSTGRYALATSGKAVIQNATLKVSNSYATINNSNSLEIKSGTFQNTGSYNTNISTKLSGAVLYNNGTAIIGGGTFTKQSTGRVIYNDKTLTINNINLTADTKGNGAGILSTGTLNINGGTFKTLDRVLLSNDGTMNISAGTFTTSAGHGSGQAIVNSATTKISGGTFQGTNTALGSLISNNALMRISNATVTSKGDATITNETTKKWGTDICTQECSLHITGTAKISNTGSGVAVRQTSTSKNGGVHTPSSFEGYIYANSDYVIDNNSTSAYAKFNGGKFYSPNAKYSNGKVTFGSGASKIKGRP